MRKGLIILLVCLPGIAAAQRFGGGVVGGINVSQIDGDSWSGYNKAGLVAGAFVTTSFHKPWGAQMELRYAAKGSAKVMRAAEPRKIRLQYIEMPLLISYEFYKVFQAQGGISLGYLFSSAQNEGDGYVEFDEYEPYELAFNVGLDYRFLEKLSVNVRFAYSILPISADYSGASFPYADSNNVFTFAFYYRIGNN